jgi:hypothetical protein
MLYSEHVHLTPAYGRDYLYRCEAEKAYKDGKDFVLSITGQYCSRRDFDGKPVEVWIRFDKGSQLIRIVRD